MKVLMVIYHSEYHDEVTGFVEKAGVSEYVEVPKAWGVDEDGRHVGTHIWPGTDSILVIPLPDPKMREVVDALRAWKESAPAHRHLRVLVLPVEEAV